VPPYPDDLIIKMKYRPLILLVLFALPGIGCFQAGLWPSPTPLPMPYELTTTPLPDGSVIGGLDAVFMSLVSVEGSKDSRCYKLYRFYQDGLALYADFTCFEGDLSTDTWSDVDRWFNRNDQTIARGDYSLSGSKIFVRIVSYQSIYETIDLRIFQGEICGTEVVLQEPDATGYTGIPSDLTQPVLEFAQLELPVQSQESFGLHSQPPTPEKSDKIDCHVAGFKILKRPTIVIAGGRAEYQIQTDPGEICSLRYIAPGGDSGLAPGSGTILTNSQGVCNWVWELGDLPGEAVVTVGIDEILQNFSLEIR